MRRFLTVALAIGLLTIPGQRQVVKSQTNYAYTEQLIKLIQTMQSQVSDMLTTIGKTQSRIGDMAPSAEPAQLYVKLAELRSKGAEVLCNRITMSLDQALNILEDPRRAEQAHRFFESAQVQFEQVFLFQEETRTLLKPADWFEDHPSTR